MRDDFLHKCHSHDRLRPIFDDLSALEKPDSDSLRRALEEPASRLGYAFEDDSIVSEMVGEIEGEHGALPLLAFAAAQLWERRDREGRLLTRQAYTAIGGVTGALARHADETLERLGPSCLPIVRELFRNLVTVENTRAVREREDLLSVFPESEREAAAGVVKELVDARLLTSYEDDEHRRRPGASHPNHPRVAAVELAPVGRLAITGRRCPPVPPRTPQASRTWDERGRPDDLVWTGGTWREFQVWRDHYPGGLTDVEEAFAGAMEAFGRHGVTRRLRSAATAAIAVLLLSSPWSGRCGDRASTRPAEPRRPNSSPSDSWPCRRSAPAPSPTPLRASRWRTPPRHDSSRSAPCGKGRPPPSFRREEMPGGLRSHPMAGSWSSATAMGCCTFYLAIQGHRSS